VWVSSVLRWARNQSLQNLLPQEAGALGAGSTLPLSKGEAA